MNKSKVTISKLIPVATLSVALFHSTIAIAAPQVSGSTVTLPEGGWIEVQDSQTYQSVCQGSNSCTVSPGIYTVINHSTGERFHDVTVASSGSSTDLSIVNESNAASLVRQAFEIFHSKAYDQRLIKATRLRDDAGEIYPSLQLTSSVKLPADRPEVELIANYTCSNGGTVTQTRFFSSAHGDHHYNYNNCQIDGDLLSGSVLTKTTLHGTLRHEFENLNVSFEPNGKMQANGSHWIATQNFGYGIATHVRDIYSNLDYLFDYSGGKLQVTSADFRSDFHLNAYIQLDNTPFTNTIREISPDSTFLMKPPFSEETFRVSVIEELHNDDENSGIYFNRGAMLIESTTDGSSLTLDAVTGDINTAQIHLEENDESVSSTVHPWSTWADVFCLDTPSLDAEYRRCM